MNVVWRRVPSPARVRRADLPDTDRSIMRLSRGFVPTLKETPTASELKGFGSREWLAGLMDPDRIATLPGVRAVGAVNILPLTGLGVGATFAVDGYYQAYIFPGVVALSLMFTASSAAVGIVFDRQLEKIIHIARIALQFRLEQSHVAGRFPVFKITIVPQVAAQAGARQGRN